MIEPLDSEAFASPPPTERFFHLCRELSLPLATARLKLLLLRGGQTEPAKGVRAVLQAVTDAETMLVTVVALCFGLAPKLIRKPFDLGAMVAHALASLPRQEGSTPIRAKLEPLVGQWNFWLCRRLVREMILFPLAISDRAPLIAAFRSPGGAVLSIHLEQADLASPEAETLRRELGRSPRQFHLWLAAQLVEAHGGELRVSSNEHGWVGLTATLPERSPATEAQSEDSPRPGVSPAQRRALIHMLRSPLSAARLRLRFVPVDPGRSGTLADVEQQLVAADSAIARLLPLTGGPTVLEPMPGDLVGIVAAAVRLGAPATTLRAVGALVGSWDRYAVESIVRNLLALSGARPLHPAVFTLEPSDGGALLSVTCLAGRPPADGTSRWLIQQLAAAHGGWSSCSSEPDPFTAQVFLHGDYSPM